MVRRIVHTKTTYLEMLAEPAETVSCPRAAVRCEQIERPTVEQYRDWYRRVGAEFHWVDRLMQPGEKLRQTLHDPLVEIYLLLVEETPAGYAELDRRRSEQIELAYFGLFPEYIGQGLGRYFLNWSIRQAWSHQPKRLWVHTCDLDHVAALPNYLRSGFQIYDERIVEQVLDDELT